MLSIARTCTFGFVIQHRSKLSVRAASTSLSDLNATTSLCSFYRGSKVAVKMVQSFANDRATALEEQRAIRKEALLMTQLKHPNIVLTMGTNTTTCGRPVSFGECDGPCPVVL